MPSQPGEQDCAASRLQGGSRPSRLLPSERYVRSPGELTHCSILCSYKNGMGDNRKALVAPLEREVQDVTLGLGKVLNWIVC